MSKCPLCGLEYEDVMHHLTRHHSQSDLAIHILEVAGFLGVFKDLVESEKEEKYTPDYDAQNRFLRKEKKK